MNRIFKQVPRILFGSGTIERISELLPSEKGENSYAVYMVDSVHQKTELMKKISLEKNDVVFWIDTTDEPKTEQIDLLVNDIINFRKLPLAIVAIGGGSTMDVGKAVSVMLTNEGPTAEYQGWDLVKNPAIFKIGIPTLSGTGAEASRTTVLTGPEKKLGINSDQSMFDAIICDSSLLSTVPVEQRFYTGMDCFIHCVESLEGTMINSLSASFAEKALNLCLDVFLNDAEDDLLMVASYFGGVSIVNSEVGICHALSYGLSLELGLHHGIANCIAFNVLDEYYGDYVKTMRSMMEKHGIQLPSPVVKDINKAKMEKMVAMTLMMERPLTNALGEKWRTILTPEKIIKLYQRM